MRAFRRVMVVSLAMICRALVEAGVSIYSGGTRKVYLLQRDKR